MAGIVQDEKVPRWAWNLLMSVVVTSLLSIVIYQWEGKSPKTPDLPALAAETVSEQKRPVIIWSKWKEIPLTEEWSEYIDTPTRKDRISPPPKGRVEVLYENGAYYELKNTSSDEKYEVIDIQMDGRFKLKGSPGTKATIWIGKQG